jgi:hypothetical protein
MCEFFREHTNDYTWPSTKAVNGVEITSVSAKTGEQLYYNSPKPPFPESSP